MNTITLIQNQDGPKGPRAVEVGVEPDSMLWFDAQGDPASLHVGAGGVETPSGAQVKADLAAAAAVAGLNTKGGFFYPEDYGPLSATVAISHTAIQAAIDAAFAAGGGTVVLPAQKCLLGASLVPRSGVTITGTQPGVTPNTGNYDLGFTITSGSILSYPGGIIFNEYEPAGYSSTDYLSRFNLQGIGFQNCATILKSGARSRRGLSGSNLRDIFGAGITDWAFDIANGQHIMANNIMLVAKGGLHYWCDSRNADEGAGNATSPGNSTWADFYLYQPQAGEVYDGIRCEVIPGSDGQLGSLTFNRPQVNRFCNPVSQPSCLTTYPICFIGNTTQKHPSIALHDVDIEGTASVGLFFSHVSMGYISVGGITTAADKVQKSIVVSDCGGVEIHNTHVDTIIECNNGTTASTTYVYGDYARCGTSNVRPRGMYRDRSRNTNAVIMQFDIYDAAHLMGDGFKITTGSGAELESTGNGYGFIARSANGTRYKLVPPNGGGAATWVAA